MIGLLEKYTEAIDYLKVVRTELVDAMYELDKASYNLSVARAKAEKNIVDNLVDGKVKALGSGADDRARILIALADNDYEYREARETHSEAQRKVNTLKAEKDSAEDKVRAINLESDSLLRSAVRDMSFGLTALINKTVAQAVIGREVANKIGGLE